MSDALKDGATSRTEDWASSMPVMTNSSFQICTRLRVDAFDDGSRADRVSWPWESNVTVQLGEQVIGMNTDKEGERPRARDVHGFVVFALPDENRRAPSLWSEMQVGDQH